MDKKKFLAIGLVACMACGVLAGCGADDKKVAENNGKIEKQVENKVDKNSKKDVKKAQNTKDVYAGLKITDANRHLGDIVNYARTSTDVNTYKPVLSAEQKDASTVFEVLGVTSEDMEEFAISLDETAENAYAVAIVKPAKDKEAVVKAGFESFIEAKKQAMDEKDTAEASIIESAKVEQVGDYLTLIMCKDGSDVITKVTEGINNPTVIENYLKEVGNTDASFREDSDKKDINDTTKSDSTTNADTNADADLNNQIVPAEGASGTDAGAIGTDGAGQEPTINVDEASNTSDTSDGWQ